MKRVAADELSDHRTSRRKRESEINRGLRDLDAAGSLAMLDDLCDRWQLGERGRALSFEDQTVRMFHEFGLEYRDNLLSVLDTDGGNFGLRAVDDKINDAELQAIGLYHRLHELGLLPEGGRAAADAAADDAADDPELETKRGNLRRMVKVLEMVFYAKKVVLGAFQAKLAVHQLHLGDGSLDLDADLNARLGSWALRFRYIDNELTPIQNLLLYLLDAAMEKRYRKSNGWLYEPVYVGGKNTHAWRPVCEVKDFVYGMLHKETCWEQWSNATKSGTKNIASAIEFLTNCSDYQLPELHKQRGVYSFHNGVYMARDDQFHRFGHGPPLPDSVVACKFVEADFVEYTCPWRDIPTPHLQSIMDYQGFDPDVCTWLYVMLGRLLYPLNQLDSWQVIPFFKGQASSGKCFAAGTRVMVHGGGTRAVEDIAVGDLVVGDDGTPRRVLTLARGEDELFAIKPSKKGYFGMTVTREHVLCLKFTNQGSVGGWKHGTRVSFFDARARTAKAKKFTDAATAEEFRASLDRDEVFEMTVGEYVALPEYLKRYLVCYRVPVDFAATEEPLFDPWTIGAWLGDGHAAGARVTAADADMVSALGGAVAARGLVLTTGTGEYCYGVSQQDGRRSKGGNPFLQALRAYGLVDNKHVPHQLKTGSRETRMAVLAGLLDTDGWKNPSGCYEISQKREALADDIVFLARSLGFGATKKEVRKAAVKPAGGPDPDARVWGTYHLVNIFGAGLSDIPLRCARKRFAPGELKPRKDSLKWGFAVEPAGRAPYYGFQTDGNQRFLLGDFTVTHNSTIILKVCKSFYDAQDVGVLSNNIERKFGLSAFYDKCLFLAPEIKSDLGIEQAEFQSVVSGEDLQVNVKHKKAFATTWSVPGALAGNEVPAWADNSGSVQRRVLLWEFVRAVVNGDMKLGEKLGAELPAILVKCNRAYLEMAGKYSHVNVWTVLPAYFKETRDQLAQSVNSVEAFLASTDVVHGLDLYCPMDEFRAALKTFEVSNNYRSKKYDTDFFRGPFTKYGLRIERAKKAYRGTNKTRDYVIGIDINNANAEDNDLG
ncbi:MAG: hypothetical protein EBS48_02990 [Actinobacteria bacterium]|nr:hypothetical protein [Actinomycetota bacterium]